MSLENLSLVSSSRPIHEHLPNEIMSKIFMRLCHNKKHTDAVENQILTLSTVCRAWNTIVEATPEVYSNYALTINHCQIQQRDLDNTVLDAKEWLERSRSHPCDLYFTIAGDLAHGDILNAMTPLAEAIAGRLRRLQLKGVMGELTRVMTVFSRELPFLKWLYLRGRAPAHLTRPFTSSPSFVRSSRLTAVELYDIFAHDSDVTTFLPYSQLTSITIHDSLITPDAIHYILSSSTRLVDCSLINPNPNLSVHERQGGIKSCQDVVLPFLIKFSFTCSYPIIFESLHLPALQELELLKIYLKEDINIGLALTGLYHRAPFKLETLRIQDVSLHVDDFTEFLSLVPELTGLHLIRCSYPRDGRLLGALSLPDVTQEVVDGTSESSESTGGEVLLPQLTEFSTLVPFRYEKPLTSFVESRLRTASNPRGQTARLESLSLGLQYLQYEEWYSYQRFAKRWEEKGLRVYLRGIDKNRSY